MLLLNDQLRHHLENWDHVDPGVVVSNDTRVTLASEAVGVSLVHDNNTNNNSNNNQDIAIVRGEREMSRPMNDNSTLVSSHADRWNDGLVSVTFGDASRASIGILVVGFALGIYSHDTWNRWTCIPYWPTEILCPLS